MSDSSLDRLQHITAQQTYTEFQSIIYFLSIILYYAIKGSTRVKKYKIQVHNKNIQETENYNIDSRENYSNMLAEKLPLMLEKLKTKIFACCSAFIF